MSADVLAEVLLATIALSVAWRLFRRRPGVAIGIGLVGFAALLGVPDYLGIALARGPHQFASIVAAAAALPLIAVSSCWPSGATATRVAGAARFAVMFGGLGVLLIGLMGMSFLGQVAPALSAVMLLAASLRTRRLVSVTGSVTLVCTLVLSAGRWTVPPLSGAQQLHLALAAWLLLLWIDHDVT